MNILRAAGIAAIAAAVTAAPSLACYQEQYDPTASVRFCGDPRAYITIDATNVSEPFTAKIVWKTGNKSIPGPKRRVIKPYIKPGEVLQVKRWVLGGSVVLVRGRDHELLLRETAKSTGPCRDVVRVFTTA